MPSAIAAQVTCCGQPVRHGKLDDDCHHQKSKSGEARRQAENKKIGSSISAEPAANAMAAGAGKG